jgi:sugar phosphate permease
VFALVRSPVPAYPVAFVLGFVYFLVITSLATVLQGHLDDSVRGRVMALWIMAFGGMVPIGVLIGGFVVEATSITAVLIAGAVAAVVLAWYCDLDAVGAAEVSGGVDRA